MMPTNGYSQKNFEFERSASGAYRSISEAPLPEPGRETGGDERSSASDFAVHRHVSHLVAFAALSLADVAVEVNARTYWARKHQEKIFLQ
jgi:hypothetical protein